MTPPARAYVGRMRGIGSLLALAVFSVATLPAQVTDTEGPLELHRNTDTTTNAPQRHAITNDTIIRMTKAGLEEPIILQTIEAQPGDYDLTPDALIALKAAGVTGRVISAMQSSGTGLGSRSKSSQRGVVPGAIAPALDEIGVYYKDRAGDWVPLKTEKVVFKSGGWIKSTLTNNIVKKDMNGHLEGEKSPLKLGTGIELLIYTPAGTDAAEYDLIRFEEKKNAREFRTLTGGVFHSESGTARNEIEFNPKKIAPQMYTFTVPVDIQKGEYGVLPPGSSNARGFADTGKIFTFSIPE